MDKELTLNEAPATLPDPVELVREGQAYYERGEWQPALDYIEQALSACRQAHQQDGQPSGHPDDPSSLHIEAHALNLLGGLYYYRAGRQKEAAGCYREALEISREIADRPGEAKALFNLAGIYQAEGRYPEAKELLDRLVTLDRELGSQDLRSHLIVLGAVRKRLKRLGLNEGER